MSERTTFVDRATGRTIWRITDSQRSDKHAYYDLCPWSPDGRHIVFSSADPKDLTEEGANIHWTQKGQVFVMDTRTWTRKRGRRGFASARIGWMRRRISAAFPCGATPGDRG